jgi:hypothetical protein
VWIYPQSIVFPDANVDKDDVNMDIGKLTVTNREYVDDF